MCSELEIKCCFSSPVYPQANDQVEAANKIIKYHLKTRLGRYKRAWVDELPSVLGAYRTTPYSATRETPYF